MSDEPNAAPDPTAAIEPAEPSDTPDQPQPDPKADAEKWKALARKHEARAKENADAAKQLAELQDAQKTAEQKLADKAAAAEARAMKAETDLLRSRVAGKLGFPTELVDLLTGEDEAAMQANAERIMSGFTTPAAAGAKPIRPVVSLQPGTGPAPSSEPKQLTQADLDRMKPEAVTAALAAGQLNTLLGVTPT